MVSDNNVHIAIIMIFSGLYPVCCAEVDSLRKVKALVESAVIGPREGNDKLASTLVCTVNL